MDRNVNWLDAGQMNSVKMKQRIRNGQALFEQLQELRETLRKIMRGAGQMTAAARELHNKAQATFSDIETLRLVPEIPETTSEAFDMSECTQLLSQFQKNHFHMVQSLERLLETSGSSHFTDDFKPIQERQKKLNSVVKEYDQIHRKLYTKGRDQSLVEHLALKESQFHKEFNVYYRDLRQSLQAVTTEIRERLCSYMFLFSDFSLTHGEQTEKLQPLLYSLTGQLKEVKQEVDPSRQLRNSKRFSCIVDRNTQQGLEKEGYITVLHSGLNTSWKLNWLVIRDGHFMCFKRWKSSTPKVDLDLRFVTVKTEFAFEESAHLLNIISPELSLVLKPPCFQDFLAWKEVLENAIKACFQAGTFISPRTRNSTPDVIYGDEHHEGKKLLQKLYQVPGNRVCADCSVDCPDWASLNLGILVCHDCSGVHRSLGVHVSKIRSTLMDRWTAAQLEIMQSLGNERANAIWEADLDPTLKPKPKERRVSKQKFILNKYVNKAYVQFPPRECSTLDAMLTVALRENNLENAYRCLVHGANINSMSHGSTLLHYAVKTDNVTCVEFLLHHDILPNLLDDLELTPLDHAQQLQHEDCTALLVACGAEKSGHAYQLPSPSSEPRVPIKKKRTLAQEHKVDKNSKLSKSMGEIDLSDVPTRSSPHAVVFRNMSPIPPSSPPNRNSDSPSVDFAPRSAKNPSAQRHSPTPQPKAPQTRYKTRLRQSSMEVKESEDEIDKE